MEDKVELLGTESWSRMLWSRLPVAMAVFDADTLVLVEASALLEPLTGYSLPELMGETILRLLPGMDRADLQMAFATPSENGVSRKASLLKKDGVAIPVRITMSRPFAYSAGRCVMCELRNAALEADMEHRLAAKRWALRAYAEAALTLVSAQSSETLLQEIAEAITRDSPFVLAAIGLVGSAPQRSIDIQAKAGTAIHYLDGIELSGSAEQATGQGPAGIAFRSGQIQVVKDIETAPNYAPWRERALQAGIRCSITVPFCIGEAQNGILGVYSSEPNAFGSVVYEAFQHLAQEIGVGLHSLRQREQIEQERQARELAQCQLAEALTTAVTAIASALEAGDPFTAGHQNRVATLACDIARDMGWGEDHVQGLRMAAMVHDIGKLAVPQEILNKPGKLTAEEFERVKVHVDVGYHILKDIPFSWPVADTMRQHHEKLDGSGYPLGICGDAILPGARVLAVADIVESMACERPYRKALGLDIALGEVQSMATADKLDPEVVRVCTAMFREKGYRLPT